MEAPAHIISRIASRDCKRKDCGYAVDAQGHRVAGGDPTMTKDADTMLSHAQPADSKAQPRCPMGFSSSSSSSSSSHKKDKEEQNEPGLMDRVASKLEGLAEKLNTSTHPLTSSDASSSSSSSAQTASHAAGPVFTSVHGIPMGDNTHSFNINGIVAASDMHLFEQQQHFNRSKVVERAVHAAGSGAFGYFEVTNPEISKLTKAKFLQPDSGQTPLFVRFSTVTYGREFPDSARNPRGIAIKFYTEEGNYDVLMINFPVFFNRDPALGPSVIRSQQRNPQNFQVNLDSTLDFMSLVPESCLANLWFWSDHGTPRGWQHMDAFPCHTFKWVNAEGEITWVRYAFKTEQGIDNFDFDSAVRMCGEDPDFAKRDLWQTIHDGKKPAWRFCVQIMTEQQAQNAEMDPFDCTKEWPVDQYPYQEVGRIVLDRNPENYHRDVELSALSPGRLVPGIELSPDPLLQFRATFYGDAQLHRIGANYHQIPVNCPFRAKQVHPLSRDGAMRSDNNGGAEAHYYPNSFNVPAPTHPDPQFNWKPQITHGIMGRRASPRTAEGSDLEYSQARDFYRRMTDTERNHLCYNVARAFASVSRSEVKLRFLMQAYQVDPSFADGVLRECQALGKDDPEVTLERVKRNVAAHPHTVNQAAGYIPFPLQ